MYSNITESIGLFQPKPPLYESLNLGNIMAETCVGYFMLHLPNFDDSPHIQFSRFFKSEREVSTTKLPESREQPISIVVAAWCKIVPEKSKFLRKRDLVNSGRDWSKLLNGKGNQFIHMPLDCKGKDGDPFFNRC